MDPDSFDGIKAFIDASRSALGLAKDAQDLVPDSEEKKAALQALEIAESSSEVAKAELAKALGYELCKCEFPPIPMLKVGYRTVGGGMREVVEVFECPKCKQNNAGPFMFERQID